MSVGGDAAAGAAVGSVVPGIGTAIGAGVGALGGIVGGLISNNNAKSAAATQEQYAIQNFNMQNAYNSPSAQMARLKAAGLNPNMVYGQGAVANSSTAPSTPSVQTGDLGRSVGAAAGGLSADFTQFFNILQTQANTAQLQAQTLQTKANTVGTGLSNDYASQTLPVRVEQASSDLDSTNFKNTGQLLSNDLAKQTNPITVQDAATQLQSDVYKAAANAFLPQQSALDIKSKLQTIDYQGIVNSFAKMGIMPNSDGYFHLVGAIIQKFLGAYSLNGSGGVILKK